VIAHPAIRDAAGVDLSDAVFGRRLAGFVLPATGLRSAIFGEIIAWVAEQLGDYNVSESFTIVREIPRNALGKTVGSY
jgi:acyl-coenzyme A synthetase/AMP-(fatty) acid ligase